MPNWRDRFRDLLIDGDHSATARHLHRTLETLARYVRNLFTRTARLERTVNELQAALAKLQTAVTDLQARATGTVNVADLKPVTDGISAAADAINAVLPAPVAPPAA